MPKRSSKLDLNQLAASIVDAATQSPRRDLPKKKAKKKNPAAVALGRLGGKKGGIARAKKLTSEERIAIARNAAYARYAKKP